MIHKKEASNAELYGDEVREKILEFAERGWRKAETVWPFSGAVNRRTESVWSELLGGSGRVSGKS